MHDYVTIIVSVSDLRTQQTRQTFVLAASCESFAFLICLLASGLGSRAKSYCLLKISEQTLPATHCGGDQDQRGGG